MRIWTLCDTLRAGAVQASLQARSVYQQFLKGVPLLMSQSGRDQNATRDVLHYVGHSNNHLATCRNGMQHVLGQRAWLED